MQTLQIGDSWMWHAGAPHLQQGLVARKLPRVRVRIVSSNRLEQPGMYVPLPRQGGKGFVRPCQGRPEEREEECSEQRHIALLRRAISE